MHGRGVGAAEAADLRGERNVCAAILKLAIRHLSEARGGDYPSAREFFESRRLDFHCGVLDLDDRIDERERFVGLLHQRVAELACVLLLPLALELRERSGLRPDLEGVTADPNGTGDGKLRHEGEVTLAAARANPSPITGDLLVPMSRIVYGVGAQLTARAGRRRLNGASLSAHAGVTAPAAASAL